jgi:hypothetical protein
LLRIYHDAVLATQEFSRICTCLGVVIAISSVLISLITT